MSHMLAERDRSAFLAAKKVQLLRLMIRQLESITAADDDQSNTDGIIGRDERSSDSEPRER